MRNMGLTDKDDEMKRPEPIALPDFNRQASGRLHELLFPPVPQMMSEMIEPYHSKEPFHWQHSGLMYNISDLKDHLCTHPHKVLRVFLERVVTSYFPDTLYLEFGTYFSLPGKPKEYNEADVTQIYALFAYVTGPDLRAAHIASILDISEGIEDIRRDYQSAKRIFDVQAPQVHAFETALKEWERKNKRPKKPKWPDYLTSNET